MLGVDWCHVRSFDYPIDNDGHPINYVRFPVNTGMMGVVPAWRLDALLDFPQEREKRLKAEDEELKRRKTSAVSRDMSGE